MRPKHKRLIFVFISCCVMAISATIILNVFRENLIYFYTPSMLKNALLKEEFDKSRALRLGGLVEQGSITHKGNNTITFRVTDGESHLTVTYQGILPTLFREGQGVVLLGTLKENGSIIASQILAKHDETYMPPEVARALKASGHWQTEGKPYPGAKDGVIQK